MAKKFQDVMTRSPRIVEASATVREAAKVMADEDIGDVIVRRGDTLCGIVTDRDITVRAVATGHDADDTNVGDICTRELVTLGPADTVDDAVSLMQQKALRRLPIVDDDGKAVGIVSLGDLAVASSGERALADISAAPPNN
jgi:CBS domain-containing protein